MNFATCLYFQLIFKGSKDASKGHHIGSLNADLTNQYVIKANDSGFYAVTTHLLQILYSIELFLKYYNTLQHNIQEYHSRIPFPSVRPQIESNRQFSCVYETLPSSYLSNDILTRLIQSPSSFYKI